MKIRDVNGCQAPGAASSTDKPLPPSCAPTPPEFRSEPSASQLKRQTIVLNALLLLLMAVPVVCASAIFLPFGVILSPLLLVPAFNAAAMWPSAKWPFESRPKRIATALWSWTWKTYLVWALFSLVSFNLLYPLALPLLLPVLRDKYMKFLPFMWPPFEAALLVACLVYACLRPFAVAKTRKLWGPLLFNIVLLAGILVFAEGYRILLVHEDLKSHHPSCVNTYSFISSVGAGWEDFQFHIHGTMVEDGVTHLWSYEEMRFVPLPHLQGWAC